MPTTLPNNNPANNNPGGYRRKSARPSESIASERSLLGATLFVAMAFAVVSGAFPAPLVLPAMSALVVLSGLTLGGWALLIRRYRGLQDDRMLDVAGVLVLFGFAAAIVCDKSEALRLLGALPGI